MIGPPLVLVGGYIEAQIRQAMPDLPEPPVWLAPVVIVFASVVAAVGQLLGDDSRSDSAGGDREPRDASTADNDSRSTEIVAALETLDVSVPPVPDADEVRTAYRERVIEAHPDQGGEAEKFIEVQKAWETITERQQLSDGDVHGEVTKES